MRNRILGLFCVLLLAPALNLLCCKWEAVTKKPETSSLDRLLDTGKVRERATERWLNSKGMSYDEVAALVTAQDAAKDELERLPERLRTVWSGEIGNKEMRVLLRDSFDRETAHFIGVKCSFALVLVGAILFLRGDRGK